MKRRVCAQPCSSHPNVTLSLNLLVNVHFEMHFFLSKCFTYVLTLYYLMSISHKQTNTCFKVVCVCFPVTLNMAPQTSYCVCLPYKCVIAKATSQSSNWYMLRQ